MPVVVRRLAADDAEALTALMADAHERGELAAASPWLEHGFRAPMVQPGLAAVAEDDDELVGAVLPDLKALVVDPERRLEGVGERLVEAGCDIVREQGGEALFLGCLPGDRGTEDFLEATGFEFHSSVWDLELEAGVPVAEPVLPPGYRARPFRRATDLETWVATFNEAFTEHPTPLSIDLAAYRNWMDEAGTRDDDTILVEDEDGALAAFASTEPQYGADGSVGERAEIWALGVRPGLQGRGLGRAALRLGIARLRSIGVRTVTLSVSGRNPRAVALYEAEGFVRTSTRDRWARPVDLPPDDEEA
ncbi:MAG TPA: GNAT family N-acetyltransferase [Candidatus Limnocylindrales bacterium]|jgi:mycothiol synthase|nr:GNAT family N-acetyltransferase [Candidatus Limnocylindrales bacterium]